MVWFFSKHDKTDPYQAYLNLESKLDALIACGEDESERGDQLREALEKLWRKLTTEQKLELNKNIDFPEVPGAVTHHGGR